MFAQWQLHVLEFVQSQLYEEIQMYLQEMKEHEFGDCGYIHLLQEGVQELSYIQREMDPAWKG